MFSLTELGNKGKEHCSYGKAGAPTLEELHREPGRRHNAHALGRRAGKSGRSNMMQRQTEKRIYLSRNSREESCLPKLK